MSAEVVSLQQFYSDYASEFQRPLAERLQRPPTLCQYIQRLDKEHAAIRKLHAQDLRYVSDDWGPWMRRMIRVPIAGAGGYFIAAVITIAPPQVKLAGWIMRGVFTAVFATAIYQCAEEEPFQAMQEVWKREMSWIRAQREVFDAPLVNFSASEKAQRVALRVYFLQLLTADFDLQREERPL